MWIELWCCGCKTSEKSESRNMQKPMAWRGWLCYDLGRRRLEEKAVCGCESLVASVASGTSSPDATLSGPDNDLVWAACWELAVRNCASPRQNKMVLGAGLEMSKVLQKLTAYRRCCAAVYILHSSVHISITRKNRALIKIPVLFQGC